MSGSESIDEYLRELKVLVLSFEVQSDSETKFKIGEACASLIQLLPLNSPAVQLSILSFLVSVKDASEFSFRRLFVENHILLVLISLLHSQNAKIKENAFNLLRGTLSMPNMDDEAAMVLPRILQILVGQASEGVLVITKSQIYALQLVLVISFRKSSGILFKKHYVLRFLRPYLLIQNYLIRLKVCEILINMTYLDVAVVEDLLRARLVPPLMEILKLTSPDSQDGVELVSLHLCALYTIANITRGPTEHREVILGCGVLEVLSPFFTSPNEDLRESACAILANLSRDSPSTCDVILESLYFSVLLQMAEGPNELVKVRARLLGLLANFAKGTTAQRKIVLNLKIVSVIDPVVKLLVSKTELTDHEVDIYGDMLTVCLYVILLSRLHKRVFFETGVLKSCFNILVATPKSDSDSTHEKFVVLQKNFIKFLLLLSKNAREYNHVMLDECRTLDQLVTILKEADSESASENIYMSKTPKVNLAEFSKYQEQVFDILTIIYSVMVNCKHDTLQKELVIESELFPVLLKFADNKYSFKVRYISCELMTIMLRLDKEIHGSLVQGGFYAQIDDSAITKIAEIFSRDNNGMEIDYQIVAIIMYVCAKDNNKYALTRWFEIMLQTGVCEKLTLVIRTISINNSINTTTIGNIIIIFFSLFKLRSERLMGMVLPSQITTVMDFFKNTIAILTKKDSSAHKVVEITTLTIRRYASISVHTKQIVANLGVMKVLFLYIYLLSLVHHVRLLPTILETFSEMAKGSDQQRLWLVQKHELIPSVAKLLVNNVELEDNTAVKGSAMVLLSTLALANLSQISELLCKEGIPKIVLDLAKDSHFNNELKMYAFSVLASLAQGPERQKDELITLGVLPVVYELMKSLTKLVGTPPNLVKPASSAVFSSPMSIASGTFPTAASAQRFSALSKPSSRVNKELLLSCLRLLVNLSSGNPRQLLQIITAGFLSVLLDLVTNPDLVVSEKACNVVRNVSNGGLNHCKAILGVNFIQPFAGIFATNRTKNDDGLNKQLRMSIDVHILWTFANVTRFEDGARVSVLDSDILDQLESVMTLKIHTKENKTLQKAIISLFNNVVLSKDCLMKITKDHAEIVAVLINELEGYNKERKESNSDDDDDSDLVVLMLNFVLILAKVDDPDFKRFLLDQEVITVLKEFSSSNAMVVRSLSQSIISSLSKT